VKPPPLQRIVGFQNHVARYKVFTVVLQLLLHKNDEKDLFSFHPANISNESCIEAKIPQ
jgi:hypothetical protein